MARPRASNRQELLARVIVTSFVIIAIAIRAYCLDGRFDYDGYDEGVYWQTLRAMRAGYSLYGEVFCSQPPVFPLSIFPFYLLFGSSISAARLGVAALSLLGVAGAYLLGKALAGRAGGIAALVFVVATPSYLEASQKLQAEGPATALLFLAAGTAFMWCAHPTGRKGFLLAASCGIVLALGTLIKLLDITAVVPIVALGFGRLWQIRREAGSRLATVLWPLAAAIATTILVLLVVLAPFLSSWPALVQQVVIFHIAARSLAAGPETNNIYVLSHFFLGNAVLSVGAVLGLILATLRRDWRIIPLALWVLVIVVALLIQVPLFSRHAIVIIPPLVAMSAFALDALPPAHQSWRVMRLSRRCAAPLAGLPPLAAILVGASPIYGYYHTQGIEAGSNETQRAAQIAEDLRRETTPDQWVITDAQFIAAMANRDTPPWLVDTSSVRIDSGYLTVPQLIQAASDQRVHAVLFATDRLERSSLSGFHSWVAKHYHPLRTYGAGIELWIR
jgi:4-amino-4-deoxy-L-arabinose transferase-like glycosyltransferase